MYTGTTNSAYLKREFHTTNKTYQMKGLVAFLCQAAPCPCKPTLPHHMLPRSLGGWAFTGGEVGWRPTVPNRSQWCPTAPNRSQQRPTRPQRHPMVPNRSQWRPMAPNRSQQHPTRPQQHPMVPNRSQWCPTAPNQTSMAPSGAQQISVAPNGSQPCPMDLSGAQQLWHSTSRLQGVGCPAAAGSFSRMPAEAPNPTLCLEATRPHPRTPLCGQLRTVPTAVTAQLFSIRTRTQLFPHGRWGTAGRAAAKGCGNRTQLHAQAQGAHFPEVSLQWCCTE